MDIRSINELGFAAFGQLLNHKADFRILQIEGILKSFGKESLEKIFQLPYGLEINPDKEYFSFVKVSAQSGKYGPLEQYILLISYKYAGIDKNKRKNYYGGCLAYKYDGYVITSYDALNYLTMVLDLSKALIVDNRSLPLGLQNFQGIKQDISFKKLSSNNQFVIPSKLSGEEINKKFIEYCYNHSGELSPVHKFILASGCEKIQGVNAYEIKVIEDSFQQVAEGNDRLFADKKVIFKEADETENKIMIENKNDSRIEEALNMQIKPLSERLEALEKKIAEISPTGSTGNFIRNTDKIFLALIVLFLIALFFLLQQVNSITISTKPSADQIQSSTKAEIKKLAASKIDSLEQVNKASEITYVAGRNDNISKIADMFKVTPDKVINKNNLVKAGDTLIIRK